MISEKEIWNVLEEVKDPEIPKVSVVEMGIITDVKVSEDNFVIVTMTPTFAGCPAVEYMKKDIKEKLTRLPVSGVDVEVNYDIQWNSNMITERGRQLLKESRFALPAEHSGVIQIEMFKNVECPNCSSKNTKLLSTFGATQCRAVHYCNDCLQMFEQIKPV